MEAKVATVTRPLPSLFMVRTADGVPHGLLHAGLAEDVPGVAGVIHRPPRPDEEADGGLGTGVADAGPEHLLRDLRFRIPRLDPARISRNASARGESSSPSSRPFSVAALIGDKRGAALTDDMEIAFPESETSAGGGRRVALSRGSDKDNGG
uniref:Uncharacterized protein n=1 Tax=Oryza glumipatula TaxID=40148 RepID=A0A0D9YWZ1_9ORYZ